MSSYANDSRKMFVTHLGREAFLCGRYEAIPADEPAALQERRRLLGRLIKPPKIAIFGEPQSGQTAVYQLTEAAMAAFPLWDPTQGDPGRVIGRMESLTMEELRRDQQEEIGEDPDATWADETTLDPKAKEAQDGRTSAFPTHMAEKKTWRITDVTHPICELSGLAVELGSTLQTFDLDLSDPDAGPTALRRWIAAGVPGRSAEDLEKVGRRVLGGDLEGARRMLDLPPLTFSSEA